MRFEGNVVMHLIMDNPAPRRPSPPQPARARAGCRAARQGAVVSGKPANTK